ncbi:MAG: ATP-dependent DNA helicase RecG [Fimbriimonadaceae bacterium]|nr:ATP-dependent DNA helicase RecG [Fimbriimonadaceae bacterium]
MSTPSLDMDVQFLKGIGPKLAAPLRKAGLLTVRDVLWRFPRRYEDRRNLPPIAAARIGESVTIRGKVTHVESRPIRGGRVIITAFVRDKSGEIRLTFFNQPWVQRSLENAAEVIAFGVVRPGDRSFELSSPEWEPIDEHTDPEEFAKIKPVYPLTEGLSQRAMRKAGLAALAFADLEVETLPTAFRQRYDLPDLTVALREMHDPTDEHRLAHARNRLVFEEFLRRQIAMAMRRAEVQLETGIAFPIDALRAGTSLNPAPTTVGLFETEALAPTPLDEQIRAMLPFELTGAQRRVIDEIFVDMARPTPMNRLVQGDVGSGKTAVAAAAILACVRSGYQAALMAPTEILAEQHTVNLTRLFQPLGIHVELVVGKLSAAQRRAAHARAASAEANVLVGTHALIQEGVTVRRLGLAVIDEQHRFGVLQRKALRDKADISPDVLVMTATPIPRTLTMTHYGDLDISVIDELPPGRKPIKTHWKRTSSRESVYAIVRGIVEAGQQAYFVCPAVGESEKLLAQAAEDLHYRLSQDVYPDLSVALLHGQMKPRDKEAVMDAFRRGEHHILVSTTVIEVGVDVPNASVMVIEDANRFGLAQLHQLRGRVGRGSAQSFCILIADTTTEDAQARMEVMVATQDGFRIAEEDLRLRGPGVVAGTQQSGHDDYLVADVIRDADLLIVARDAARDVVARDPALEAPEWQLFRQRMRTATETLTIASVS